MRATGIPYASERSVAREQLSHVYRPGSLVPGPPFFPISRGWPGAGLVSLMVAASNSGPVFGQMRRRRRRLTQALEDSYSHATSLSLGLQNYIAWATVNS